MENDVVFLTEMLLYLYGSTIYSMTEKQKDTLTNFFLEVQEITLRVIIKRSIVLYMQNTCTLYLNSLMKIKNGTLDSCVIKLSHKTNRVQKCTALTIIKH